MLVYLEVDHILSSLLYFLIALILSVLKCYVVCQELMVKRKNSKNLLEKKKRTKLTKREIKTKNYLGEKKNNYEVISVALLRVKVLKIANTSDFCK